MHLVNKNLLERLAVPLIMLGLTLVYFIGINNISSQFDEGLVGPQFLPFLLAISSCALLLIIIRKEWHDAKQLAEKAPVECNQFRWRPFWIFLTILGYVAVFKFIGYPLATLALSFIILTLLADKGYGMIRRIITSGIIVGIFYILFAIIFSVRLPLGFGIVL